MRHLSIAVVTAISALLSFTHATAGTNHWTTAGPEPASVIRIVADPTDADVAYALAIGAGVYRTTNGGQRWRPVNEGFPHLAISSLLFVAGRPSTLYAGAEDGNIYRSLDRGEHWSSRGSLPSTPVLSLAFDRKSETLYAGTNRGVFYSVDGGATWADAALLRGMVVTSLAVSPSGTAYARAFAFPGTGNLFRSKDGRLWEIVRAAPSDPHEIAADPLSAVIYLVASGDLFVSADEGRSWSKLPSITSGSPRISRVISDGAGLLYVSTSHGVYRYSERLRAWTAVGTALAQKSVGAVAMTSSSPHRLYAVSSFAVFSIADGESDWHPANHGLDGAYTEDVAVASASTIYAASWSGIFRTHYGGDRWERSHQSRMRHLAVSHETPGTVFAAGDEGILKSTDGGSSWQTVNTKRATAMTFSGSNLYAALVDGMAKSSDGQSWAAIMSGLPGGDFWTYGLDAMAAAPSDPSTVFIAWSFAGVYRTSNGGETWSQVSKRNNIDELVVDPTAASIVYAASQTGGVLRSIDAGQSWAAAGLSDKRVRALAFGGPAVMYAGTDDGRVYRTTDRGRYWHVLDQGLGRAAVLDLSIDDSGNHLDAATSAGVYGYDQVDELRIEPLIQDSSQLNELLARAGPHGAVVFPIAGTAIGAGATLFTTDVSLFNPRRSKQNVFVVWLPQNGSPESFRIELPQADDAGDGTAAITDIGERLGVSGLGALVAIGLDSDASIRGTARVWAHPYEGRAPFAHSIPAAAHGALSSRGDATISGLQHDDAYRTNLAIVNLSPEQRKYTVRVDGERASREIELIVAPFSMVQIQVPDADYGKLKASVSSDRSSSWLLCGTTIDRASGNARTVLGTSE